MTKTDDGTEPTTLGDFEGDTIVRSEVAVTKIGDGLSDALKVDPVALHRGDRVFLIIEAECRHVAFPPIEKGSDLLARKHVLDAVEVALVDEEDVEKLMAANRDRVQRALDSMKGQGTVDPVSGEATPAAEANDELDRLLETLDDDDPDEETRDALRAGGIEVD